MHGLSVFPWPAAYCERQRRIESLLGKGKFLGKGEGADMKVTEIFTLGYGGRDDDHRNRDGHRHDGRYGDWDRRYWRREYRYWDRGNNCWRWYR